MSDNPSEEVRIYVTKHKKQTNDPRVSLNTFKRISISLNKTKTIDVTLNDKAFSEYDYRGNLILERGGYNIPISSSLHLKES